MTPDARLAFELVAGATGLDPADVLRRPLERGRGARARAGTVRIALWAFARARPSWPNTRIAADCEVSADTVRRAREARVGAVAAAVLDTFLEIAGRGEVHVTPPPRPPRTVFHGEDHPAAILEPSDVLDIRRRAALGETAADIAPDYPVGRRHVGAIIRRKRWAAPIPGDQP